MQHDVSIVNDDPFTRLLAFDAVRGNAALAELFPHVPCYRARLSLGFDRADNEVIEDAQVLTHVDNDDIFGKLVGQKVVDLLYEFLAGDVNGKVSPFLCILLRGPG